LHPHIGIHNFLGAEHTRVRIPLKGMRVCVFVCVCVCVRVCVCVIM
jgi:hypothetical protein